MSLSRKFLATIRTNPALLAVIAAGLVLATVPLTNATHFGTGGNRPMGSIVAADADVSRDGLVTGKDAMFLRQHLAGTRPTL